MIGAFALNTGNNRHIPGTLIQVFPDNHPFHGGDMTDYILRKISTNFSSEELQLKAHQKKLAVNPSLLSNRLLERQAQSENWRLFAKDKFSPVLTVENVGIKPNLKDVLYVDAVFMDTPVIQHVKYLDLSDEETKPSQLLSQ